MTTSVGVALSEPGNDTEQVLRNADIAMYNAKAAGKARFVVFQTHMQEQLRERLRLEEDINRALERGEFFLEYQPVVDLDKRELLGVEALVRWNHPERGIIAPAKFLPMAESSGLADTLSAWVLRSACEHLAVWRKRFDSELRVSVNLTARAFENPVLGQRIGEILDEGSKKILLNLSDMDYIDSNGLGELVQAFKESQRKGASLRLLKPQDRVTKTLRLTNLLPMFQVYESEDEALKAFGAS